MRRSTERILTTHTGSLPRPDYLLDFVTAGGRGRADPEAAQERVRQAVTETVHKQAEHGVDVLNDGEMGKESYSTYVRERLSGFDGPPESSIGMPDMLEFPRYMQRFMSETSAGTEGMLAPPSCTGPIAVKDRQQVQTDIANVQAAAAEVHAEEVFLSAASPGVISLFFVDRHYGNREDYLRAITAAMKEEYEAIAAAGILLQLDCPDLAMGRHLQFGGVDLAEFRRQARLNVEALNEATAGIDPDQMRMHLCWGNYPGPHHKDVELKDIIDIVLSARPNAISLEAANPRHEHEWSVFEQTALPDGKVLIPGVVDSTNNYIEHPELIAQRLGRYARLVGKENVIAGTDCGFGTAAGLAVVDPDIAWAKFDAMVAGARLADATVS